MATLEQRLNNLASAIGADIKALRDTSGVLANLPTTAKNNLVAAIAEVYSMANIGIGNPDVDLISAYNTAKA